MLAGRANSKDPSNRSRSGAVAIEFAFSLLFLLPLVFGTAELGIAVYQSMQVYAAVEAGAMHALTNGWDEPGIINAVQQTFGATPQNDVTNVTATPPPTHFCGCPTGSNVVDTGMVPPCTTYPNCANGNPQREYIEISASLPRASMIPSATFGLPATFSARSIVRMR